jgi:hypothetical protein
MLTQLRDLHGAGDETADEVLTAADAMVASALQSSRQVHHSLLTCRLMLHIPRKSVCMTVQRRMPQHRL